MMSDSSAGVIVFATIFMSVVAFNSDIFESSKTTEYIEAERCVLAASVAKDVATHRPIKQDSDGKWQWYTPEPSDQKCFQDNLNKINYRTYGEASKVVAWVNEGELNGEIVEFKDCAIADAKNWTCTPPFRSMKDGISNSGHVGHWKWTLNWMLDFVRVGRQPGE